MKQNSFTIPANAIRLTAKGVAKTLSATLDLFAIPKANGDMQIAATSSLTGESVHNVDLVNHEGKKCLHLSKYEVKTLLGKDLPGAYILVEGYNSEELEAAKTTLKTLATEAAKVEIAAIPDETPITMWVRWGSYSDYAGFNMDASISARAKELIEQDIKLVRNKKRDLFVWQSEEDRYNEDVPKSVTTWGEFRKIASELRAEKEEAQSAKNAERAAKFAEAKATGRPVQLSFYTAPEHETPLKNDGEGDIVTCCEMAMPDGSIKWEYHHNY